LSELAKYTAERVWKDGEFVLSHAVRKVDSTPVLVRASAMEQPAPETRRRLEYAYSLPHELDSAWTVRPVALVDHDGRPALILEDPGRRVPEPPELTDTTLDYLAPEQTGRMHRPTDSRSDLYADGMMLYKIATGVLPFTAKDPMELIHCHLAVQHLRQDERRQPHRSYRRRDTAWPDSAICEICGFNSEIRRYEPGIDIHIAEGVSPSAYRPATERGSANSPQPNSRSRCCTCQE
jgi:serine/threonine protein kinase